MISAYRRLSGCHRLRGHPLRSRSVHPRLPLGVSQIIPGLSTSPPYASGSAAHPCDAADLAQTAQKPRPLPCAGLTCSLALRPIDMGQPMVSTAGVTHSAISPLRPGAGDGTRTRFSALGGRRLNPWTTLAYNCQLFKVCRGPSPPRQALKSEKRYSIDKSVRMCPPGGWPRTNGDRGGNRTSRLRLC